MEVFQFDSVNDMASNTDSPRRGPRVVEISVS
jgi:hypothetical protein